jgi:Flp pilus assembly secretin CpaC
MRKVRESSMALVFGRLMLALIFAFCAVAVIAPRPAPAAEMMVTLDQAAVIKLPEQVATIVIGNPVIADASLQSGGTMVVTGKGYGTTNIIALDRNGTVLMERLVTVRGPRDAVVVYRGIERESYSCMPICQRRVTLGDGTDHFKAAMEQAESLSGAASGQASSAAKSPN